MRVCGPTLLSAVLSFSFCLCAGEPVEKIRTSGLSATVQVIRDRWGVPHIYATNTHDLFFAQGFITARDRLWQIDLWRRVGSGKLAEVLGPDAVRRDRFARLVRFRGDWNAEWAAYSPDARQIVTSFTSGINAYIRSLHGTRPLEFRLAGYDPGFWNPEDCAARIAGLLMIRNLTREVQRVQDIRRFGLETVERRLPPDPPVPIRIPNGLDLQDIGNEILRDYTEAVGAVRFPAVAAALPAVPLPTFRLSEPPPVEALPAPGWNEEVQGSNNWVVDGTRTVSGRPLLASDPHRPLLIPSLRKTVHLVAPGWNVIGAGEPALPAIALGHNDEVGFGFTIVGIDQADLYVEKLNPRNPDEYLHRGTWRKMEVVRESIAVRGQPARTVELRYTMHGPVIYENRDRHRAYALRWVGAEPGGAGYLAALAVARARNWPEFRRAMASYKVPSENMVYADRAGNIGWIAAGWAPVRPNWNGLLPVPGDSGEYEWQGFLPPAENPWAFNPQQHFIATANQNILPSGYPHALGYEWALPFRFQRVEEMLRTGPAKMGVADFQRMQQDVTSVPARRFQAVLKRWSPPEGSPAAAVARQLLAWDASLTAASVEALIFEQWMALLPRYVFGPELGARTDLAMLLNALDTAALDPVLLPSLNEALRELENAFGSDRSRWSWGRAHRIHFRHPLGNAAWDVGPLARPGDAHTVNSTSGPGFLQTNGASYRHILDLSDWDKSVTTNTPGEVGDPSSPHYSDLAAEWASGGYHPLPFSRQAVEAAAESRIVLEPER